MNRIALLAAVVAMSLCAAPAAAQIVYSMDMTIGAGSLPVNCPSGSYPLGGIGVGALDGLVGPTTFPAFGTSIALPGFTTVNPGPVAVTFGGQAIDQVNALIWSTDGISSICSDLHPSYPALGNIPVTAVLPTGISVPISGLAMDPIDRFGINGGRPVLWSIGGGPGAGEIIAMDALAATSGVPVPTATLLPAPVALPTPPALAFSGFAFEPSTLNFIATDVDGTIYRYAGPAGGFAELSRQPPVAGVVPGSIGGLAINTSNGPGAFPILPGSPQLPTGAYHIMISDGTRIIDAEATSPTAAASIPYLGAQGMCTGLAYCSDLQKLHVTPTAPCAAGGCVPPFPLPPAPTVFGNNASLRTTLVRPLIAGPTGSSTPAFVIDGSVAPGVPVSLWLSVRGLGGPISFNNGGPGSPLSRPENLWLLPGPFGDAFDTAILPGQTAVFASVPTAAGFGGFTPPLPSFAAPYGISITVQGVMADASQPSLFTLTEGASMAWSLP